MCCYEAVGIWSCINSSLKTFCFKRGIRAFIFVHQWKYADAESYSVQVRPSVSSPGVNQNRIPAKKWTHLFQNKCLQSFEEQLHQSASAGITTISFIHAHTLSCKPNSHKTALNLSCLKAVPSHVNGITALCWGYRRTTIWLSKMWKLWKTTWGAEGPYKNYKLLQINTNSRQEHYLKICLALNCFISAIVHTWVKWTGSRE